MAFKQWMKDHSACNEATSWVNDLTVEQAWQTCERADWMLWALARTDFPQTELVRLCVEIARTVQHLNPDPRVSKCLDITEAWCDGKASLEEIEKARIATYDAANAAFTTANAIANAAAYYAACAANAAYYAVDAARAANAAFTTANAIANAAAYYAACAACAANAAYYAVDAARAADGTTYAAANAANGTGITREAALKTYADLIRVRVSIETVVELVKSCF
jgi:hypothetical protein